MFRFIWSRVVSGGFSSTRVFNLYSVWICQSLPMKEQWFKQLDPIPYRSSLILAEHYYYFALAHTGFLILAELTKQFSHCCNSSKMGQVFTDENSEDCRAPRKTAPYITVTADFWQLLCVSDYSTGFAPTLPLFLAESASITCLPACHTRYCPKASVKTTSIVPPSFTDLLPCYQGRSLFALHDFFLTNLYWLPPIALLFARKIIGLFFTNCSTVYLRKRVFMFSLTSEN